MLDYYPYIGLMITKMNVLSVVILQQLGIIMADLV